MPDETKPSTAAVALAIIGVLAIAAVFALAFQACWNHGFAHAVGGGQLDFNQTCGTIVVLYLAAILVKLGITR